MKTFSRETYKYIDLVLFGSCRVIYGAGCLWRAPVYISLNSFIAHNYITHFLGKLSILTGYEPKSLTLSNQQQLLVHVKS